MSIPGAFIGCLICGLIGAAVWTAICGGTGYEVGWIAWGIGFIVGIGARVGAGREGEGPAGVAVVVSLLSILVGKYATASLLGAPFSSLFGPYDLLWFGLAAFTAFRVASSEGSKE